MPAASNKQENIDDDSNTHSKNRDKKSVESQECVGRVSDKNIYSPEKDIRGNGS